MTTSNLCRLILSDPLINPRSIRCADPDHTPICFLDFEDGTSVTVIGNRHPEETFTFAHRDKDGWILKSFDILMKSQLQDELKRISGEGSSVSLSHDSRDGIRWQGNWGFRGEHVIHPYSDNPTPPKGAYAWSHVRCKKRDLGKSLGERRWKQKGGTVWLGGTVYKKEDLNAFPRMKDCESDHVIRTDHGLWFPFYDGDKILDTRQQGH